MNKSRTSSIINKSQSQDDDKAQIKKLMEVKDKIRISFGPSLGQVQDDFLDDFEAVQLEKEQTYIRIKNTREETHL